MALLQPTTVANDNQYIQLSNIYPWAQHSNIHLMPTRGSTDAVYPSIPPAIKIRILLRYASPPFKFVATISDTIRQSLVPPTYTNGSTCRAFTTRLVRIRMVILGIRS